MNIIKIIKDLAELEGSCYIEILPGQYQGKCWNQESVFFDEETFGYFEKIIETEYADYDHYAFNEITRDVWLRIVTRIEVAIDALKNDIKKEDLKNHFGFVYQFGETEFIENFEENVEKLRILFQEFKEWIDLELKKNSVISILGI